MLGGLVDYVVAPCVDGLAVCVGGLPYEVLGRSEQAGFAGMEQIRMCVIRDVLVNNPGRLFVVVDEAGFRLVPSGLDTSP